jgi:hypothetical protein
MTRKTRRSLAVLSVLIGLSLIPGQANAIACADPLCMGGGSGSLGSHGDFCYFEFGSMHCS